VVETGYRCGDLEGREGRLRGTGRKLVVGLKGGKVSLKSGEGGFRVRRDGLVWI
jgi:hypothetical protein